MMPWDEVKDMIQEFDSVGTFNQTTLRHWNDLMSDHNRTISRGERMLLLPCSANNAGWIKFRCLDLFMLRMQGVYLANLLADFSSFGERVVRLIQESPASPCWVIGGPLVVERTRWYQLCEQMMTLLHVLGMADPPSARQRRRPWPDRDLREAAASRARGVFGSFARADTAMPSIRARIGPTPAAAAGPRSRAAKRRREDSAPACPPPRAACARAKGDPEPGPRGPQHLRQQRSVAPAAAARSRPAAAPP